MIYQETDDYTIRAKTGWARNEIEDIGWWVGYIEETDNVYFFATRLTKERKSENPGFSQCRKDITMAIMRELQFLE